MKITALYTLSFAASVLADGCSVYPELNNAIDQFCHKKDASGKLTNDLMVPSNYADMGVQIGSLLVKIYGSCNPPQYVPADICVQQFHDMCAGGAEENNAAYGWNQLPGSRCQAWYYGDLWKPSSFRTVADQFYADRKNGGHS